MKAQRLLSKAVTDSGAPGISLTVGINQQTCHVNQLVRLGGQESPALNLRSKPPSLALTLKVNRATKMSRVRQGVSTNHTACGKQSTLLASYNKIPKQLPVRRMECHSLDHEERHLQLPVLVLETCELFTMTDDRRHF